MVRVKGGLVQAFPITSKTVAKYAADVITNVGEYDLIHALEDSEVKFTFDGHELTVTMYAGSDYSIDEATQITINSGSVLLG